MSAVIRWLTPPADGGAVRTWRRWSSAVLLVYLVARAPALVTSPSTWRPVGVLAPFTQAPSGGVLIGLWSIAVVGSVALLVDRFARAAMVATAIAAVALLTARSSGGQILWFDVLPALHLLVLAALAVQRPGDDESQARIEGWALRLGAFITTATYVVAGVAKFRIGGAAWIGDGALERHISYSATRLEVLGGTASPLAEPLVDLGIASLPLALAAIAIELGSPLALVRRSWAIAWSVAAWIMHATIAGTMFVLFHWPLLGAAFVPVVLVHGRGSTPAKPTWRGSNRSAGTNPVGSHERQPM